MFVRSYKNEKKKKKEVEDLRNRRMSTWELVV
jgi:hypothetical protein